MMKNKAFCCLFIVLALLNSNIAYATDFPPEEPFFNLVLLMNYNNPFSDYAPYLAKYLADINIGMQVLDYTNVPFLVDPNILSNSWDLLFFEIPMEPYDMRPYYTEEGSKNFFGLNKKIPYNNESELLQYQAVSEHDLDERQQHYHDWIKLFTDKILIALPFYTNRLYEVIWTNTKDFDMRWGLSDSLPYMYYDGEHDGQESLEEFNIANGMWKDLNPLLSRNDASNQIIELISEPLLTWSPDYVPLKTGLVHDWKQIEDCHYKFSLRDNLFWNPSYNVTLNVDDSLPLENSPLMYGLKGEQSDGLNQQITAKDAVFTILTFANNLTNSKSYQYEWLTDCYVDEGDSLSFHVKIDDDPITVEREYYIDFFKFMSIPILPEFFLNSTSDSISYTDGGIKCWGLYPELVDAAQWKDYSKSAFSCGKYMLYYTDENLNSVLHRNPLWFGVGAIDGAPEMQPFVEKINVKYIPDSLQALMEFKLGKLDLCNVTEFSEERKNMQADVRFEVQLKYEETFSLLAFNMKRSIIGGSENYIFLEEPGKEEYTKALAVRKAICYAIDRKEINQAEHDGENIICNAPFYWPSYYYSWEPTKYYRDLDAAREWMEAAGYILELGKTSTMDVLAMLLIFTSITIFSKYRRRRNGRI